MRKLRLIIALLFITSASNAQGLFTYMNLSTEFFIALNDKKYDVATTYFDESLKDKVTAKALENAWTQIHGQLGNFKSVDGAKNRSQDDFQSVILNCQFENGSQPFQFIFNKNQKLLGFFLAPKSDIENYKIPAYADTTSYKEKFITLKTGKYELPGLITIPKIGSNFPIVIFVHGSGSLDMDATVGANKPFKDIAIGLASKGIASIRYVKRTTLYPADFQNNFTLKQEVEEDALTAIEFAKKTENIDASKIYIFGHSLGGMVAPKLANLTSDINGIILAATPARSFTDLAIDQNNYLLTQSKDTSSNTKNAVSKNIEELKKAALIKPGIVTKDSIILGLPTNYWADLNSLNTLATTKKLKNRLLILQGGNDFQVTQIDYKIWEDAFKKKKSVSLKYYPMLNHLFSFVTEKGTANQYQIPGNVDAVLINDLVDWIKL